ncbi:unnamed protein product [Rhizophagus irregularis]|nr:unnamed protein product [Rhizophagus irregularis]
MSSNNNLKDDDETFLKEFLKDFYHHIIKIDNYEKFEIILKEWVKDYFNINEKNPKMILKLMEDHEENYNWFSSLIGFFYEHDIIVVDDDDDDDGNTIIDKDKSLKLYLLSINNNDDDENENKKLISSMYQLLNIIISKYLLSFYYYKDIILSKRDLIAKESGHHDNTYIMSYNQVENFDGLEINLCKDEISTMEKYFESKDKESINENQMENKELIELNNLGYCYQHGVIVIKMGSE